MVAKGHPGGPADTAVVTVTLATVATVAVSPSTASLAAGQWVQLTATPLDAAGNPLSGRLVTWASTNPSVATVSDGGLVSGVAAGAATVTVACEGQSTAVAITVTVVPVASVALSPASATVTVGQTVQLTATPKDANGNPLTGRTVTWATSNPALAAVSGNGLVTGGAGGTATITASSEGQNGSAAITVTLVPVSSVAVSSASASLTVGQTLQLTATPKDANGNPLTGRVVTWATSNAAVVAVSASGLVTAVAAGSATITATSEGKNGTAAITVTAAATNPGTVTDLRVAGVTDTGATLAFTEVNDGTGQPASYDVRVAVAPLSWGGSSSVTRGTCTTPVAGSAIGAPRTCTVLGLQPGTTYAFQLVAFRGTLQVDAVFGGLSNIAPATTVPSTAAVATVAISPASASVAVGSTQQLSAVVKDANGNVLTGRVVTWTSNNVAVALVSSSGLVTGLTLGSATLTGTSEGKSGSATITVTNSSGAPEPGPTSTIILRDDFESGDLSSWTQSPNTGRYSISTNAARVKFGARSLEALYTPSNTYGILTRWFMPGYDEIYVKFYVMFEENFENPGMHFFTLCGNRVDNQSSCWGKAAQVPNGTDFFYAGIDPEYNTGNPILYPFHYYTYWPDMNCCYGNRFYQTLPKTPLVGGQWQEVVFHVKLNTPGQNNGSQTLWLNGVKKIDVQNMRWRDTYDVTLNNIRFDNYMAAGPSKTEHIWVDDVMVWRP